MAVRCQLGLYHVGRPLCQEKEEEEGGEGGPAWHTTHLSKSCLLKNPASPFHLEAERALVLDSTLSFVPPSGGSESPAHLPPSPGANQETLPPLEAAGMCICVCLPSTAVTTWTTP